MKMGDCAMRMAVGLTLAIAAPIPGAGPLAAQTARSAEAEELVLDREIFVYSGDSRRDPFRPVLPADSAGPRFEELRMMGVVLSPDPRQSVALLGETALPPMPTSRASRTFRVRQETVFGQMRILRVERTRVIVEFDRFGTREVGVLELHRGRERDGP